MGQTYGKENEPEQERLIFVEGAPPVRMEDAEKITVSVNMKGAVYGTRNEEGNTSCEAGDCED